MKSLLLLIIHISSLGAKRTVPSFASDDALTKSSAESPFAVGRSSEVTGKDIAPECKNISVLENVPQSVPHCSDGGAKRIFPIEYVLPEIAKANNATPPLEMGTSENICVPPDLDITGIWWMSGLPHEINGTIVEGANELDEYLISFAGTVTNSTTYPAHLTAPTNLAGHWTWGHDVSGSTLMNYYAQFNEVTNHQHFTFKNGSHGEIEVVAKVLKSIGGLAFAFEKASEDEWLRTNYNRSQPMSPENADYKYKLVRIVKQDGTKTSYWDSYVNYMHNRSNFNGWGLRPRGKTMKRMQAWATNNACMRKCQAIGTPCRLCKGICRVGKKKH